MLTFVLNVQLKMNEFNWTGRLEYKQKTNSCYKEYNLTLAYFSFCFFFPIPLLIQFPAIYTFFVDSETKDN